MNPGDLVELIKASYLYEAERLGQIARIILIADTSRGILLFIEFPDGVQHTVRINQVRVIYSI